MKYYVCENCGWTNEYRGGRKRKKCPKCGSENIKIVDETYFVKDEQKIEEKIEQPIEEQKEETIMNLSEPQKLVDEKELKNLSNQFFRFSMENSEMVDSNSDYYPFIKLIVEQAYKPKQIREFKPSDGAIRQYAKLLEYNYPQSRISDPRTALIVSTLILFAPAILYYGNEALKKLRLFRKNREKDKQNKENIVVDKKETKKEINILDIK